QEEWVATLDEQLLERCEHGIITEKRLEQLASALRWQRVQSGLAVGGLAAPSVPVLGPIVDEKEQACRAQALHHSVKQGLRLTVDPVQVFEDHEEWLLSSFA